MMKNNIYILLSTFFMFCKMSQKYNKPGIEMLCSSLRNELWSVLVPNSYKIITIYSHKHPPLMHHLKILHVDFTFFYR